MDARAAYKAITLWMLELRLKRDDDAMDAGAAYKIMTVWMLELRIKAWRYRS